ncbi:MAG TPA: hypothetical protein VIY51_15215 [Xanthobacteraceae bacterium]
MAQAGEIIALSERLRRQSRKARNAEIVADLRLATCYLRALAALKIAEEAEIEIDPGRKLQLELESAQLNSQLRREH